MLRNASRLVLTFITNLRDELEKALSELCKVSTLPRLLSVSVAKRFGCPWRPEQGFCVSAGNGFANQGRINREVAWFFPYCRNLTVTSLEQVWVPASHTLYTY